jgi:protein disulfide-isomerase A1
VQFCEQQDVGSHPAIRAYFPDNTVERYRGPRKAASIASFLNRISGPSVADLTSEQLPSFLAGDHVSVVLQAPPGQDNLVENFETVAHRYHDRYSFGLLLGEGQAPALRCQNNVDRLEYSTSELTTVASVESFVRQCGADLIGEMTRRNELSYVKAGKSIVVYFTDSEVDREEYVKATRALAKKYREYLAFVTVDTDEYPDMVAAMGHAPGATGVLALQNPHNWQVFPLAGDVDPASIEAFIVEISQGQVQPWDGQAPVVAKARKKEMGGGGRNTLPVQPRDEL